MERKYLNGSICEKLLGEDLEVRVLFEYQLGKALSRKVKLT